jgi:hypothetical protein
MNQQKDDGRYGATKIFPCDCGTEGIMVAVELDDEYVEPAIRMAFWQMATKFKDSSELTRWNRIKVAWRILCGDSPYADMVWMTSDTARNLANHILYLLAKMKRKRNNEEKVKEKNRPIVLME